MISLTFLTVALLPYALAAPQPHLANTLHVPISRRSVSNRVQNLPQTMDGIRTKYGLPAVNPNSKRATTAAISLTDEQNDSSYSGVVSIGTLAQSFNVVLDTGSSDLWVATDGCAACNPSTTPLFDTATSSTYKNESSPLQISYGSGEVGGYVSEDTVSFGGFTMSQEFLAVVATTSDLLSPGLSGIMGLGFKTISALQTTPFWVALYDANMLSSPMLSFYLERNIDDPQVVNAAPGGVLTLGGTNTSLYTGEIEYIPFPTDTTPSYWLQQVTTVTVQGKSINVPLSSSLAAIDTGTTLLGAPSSIASELWANVPGSQALTGEMQGSFTFPCDTNVSVYISFGGQSWPINPVDINIGPLEPGSNLCVGAIFDVGSELGSGGAAEGVPAWIVGDTFLKNVYSVFDASTPSVGFAELANGLSSGTPLGSNGTTSSSPGSSGSSSNDALPSAMCSLSLTLFIALIGGFFVNL